MTLLLIPAIWILGLALVAGLCMAASRGDSQQVPARTEARQDRRRLQGEKSHGTGARRAEHGELAGAGRAAA